jgi:hypothetical protein
MSNETNVIEEPIYYYMGKDDIKYYTPSFLLAVTRAKFHGNEDVYKVK